jgi:hypothetical protein
MSSSLCVFRAEKRPATVVFRVKSLFVAIAIIFCACIGSVQAQIQSPNNQLNTLSPIGVPPHATLEGTNELVDLATGNLTLYLPMLSLPQRGGWTLPLGYTYDSRLYSPVQITSPSTTVYTTDGQPFSVTSYQYLETFNQLTGVLTPTMSAGAKLGHSAPRERCALAE